MPTPALNTTPLFENSPIWTNLRTMATTTATEMTNAINSASTTDFSDPGAVVELQMRINQITNAQTAVSNLVKAVMEPSKNAVSNLR